MTETDPYSRSRAITGPPLLANFNDAGILDAADIHVAVRLGRLAGEADESVLLAVALTVCATRLGNVRLDLETAAGLADALGVPAERQPPWPPTQSWLAAVGASPLVGGPTPVLRLLGTCLYLDRYLRYEERLADNLTTRRAAVGGVDEALLARGLDRLFAAGEQVEADEQQRTAAQVAVRQHFSVIAGGPGTGKTTTVAKIMALICEQQGGGNRPLLIGLTIVIFGLTVCF
ncbi:MAG: AAA family ATPase, partial [Actinomycetes bacterium]